jgi:hypothetical protein
MPVEVRERKSTDLYLPEAENGQGSDPRAEAGARRE